MIITPTLGDKELNKATSGLQHHTHHLPSSGLCKEMHLGRVITELMDRKEVPVIALMKSCL